MTGVVGISFHTAQVAIREKLAFSDEQAVSFMNGLKKELGIEGVVLLSTCNRTEIYFYKDGQNEELLPQVIQSLLLFKKIESANDNLFYHYTGDDCARHLFRVTAGLESMIIGEYQILGQVKDGFRISSENNFLAPVISRMFHKSFEVGKAARNLYRMGSVSQSAGEAAVKKVKATLGNITHESVLVIGAGQTARSVLDSLNSEHCEHVTVINRDAEKAKLISYQYNTQISVFENLVDELAKASIVFVTTAATHPVITCQNMGEALLQRNKQPVILFDLSVPRNIEPEVVDLKSVKLFAIDDLSLTENTADVMGEDIMEIEGVIEKTLTEYKEWLATLNLVPTIEQLRERFNEVLERRLSFVEHKMSPEEFQAVTVNGKFLTDKFLQMIIHSLRETSNNGRYSSYIDMVNNMLKYHNND
jgi:glutamyl-tRNA reductase